VTWFEARLQCDAVPEGAWVLSISATEGMNELPRWEVSLGCDDPGVDLGALLGAPASLSLIDTVFGTSRDIPLLVGGAAWLEELRDGHIYSLSLVGREALLGLREGYRVFVDKTAQEIVDAVLQDSGIEAEWRLRTGVFPRPHTVQYAETDWAFVERLLAEEGIAYWMDADADAGTPRLIFADDSASHDGIDVSPLVPFSDPSEGINQRHFHELAVTGELTPTGVTLRDHDVRAPDVPIEGVAGEAAFEIFEFPASTVSSKAAEARAAARLQQWQRRARHATGRSDCPRLAPGRVVEIAGCADEWMNGRWLVTRLAHEARLRAVRQSNAAGYGNVATLAPIDAQTYRPSPPRRLAIAGVEPATTTGPAGSEIHVDDLARVKLRFPWDRSGRADDTSSGWMRTQQQNLGGAMILPRVGWEVPVAYLDGNPDRPMVLGRLYNGAAIVPYGLPGGSATTTFQSASSPGGGTTNELRMGDSAGGMEVFLHAQKDQTVTVGGSAEATVGADDTHDVTLSYGVAVKGSQTTTVGASQSVDVGTNYGTTAKGARSETVGAMEVTKVTANRAVKADGSYTELVGAIYGIQCNQSNTEVKATFTQLIGGSLNLAAGLGTGETVAAARTELVGGGRSIDASRDSSESVIGAKAVTAGATKEKSGGPMVTTTKVAGSIIVGGAAKLEAGGNISIDAASVTIDVSGSLKTPSFTLGGGKLSVKKGTSKLKGTVKHTAKSKMGG
jgi:type VI secretion system secreted protein VgrG